MRILLWNIQDGGVLSLNHPDRSNLQNILTVIRDLVPDLTVLPEYETEYRRIFLEEGLIPLGYTCAVCEDAPDATLRKRTLLAAKRPFTTLPRPMEILRYSWRNWIEAAFPESGLRLLGIHVPLAQTSGRFGDSRDNCREKRLFLEELRRRFTEYAALSSPALILGDFNLYPGAVYGEMLKDFSTALTELTKGEPTWNKRKLDFLFANEVFRSRVTFVSEPQKTPFSDHAYLYLDADL